MGTKALPVVVWTAGGRNACACSLGCCWGAVWGGPVGGCRGCVRPSRFTQTAWCRRGAPLCLRLWQVGCCWALLLSAAVVACQRKLPFHATKNDWGIVCK